MTFINERTGFMQTHAPTIVQTTDYIYVRHDKYARLIRYSRGIHLSLETFECVFDTLDEHARSYFFFHNSPAHTINIGSYLNGHASFAVAAFRYFEERGLSLHELMNGQDFYIHIVE